MDLTMQLLKTIYTYKEIQLHEIQYKRLLHLQAVLFYIKQLWSRWDHVTDWKQQIFLCI